MKLKSLITVCTFSVFIAFSQSPEKYIALTIAPELSESANAVVRYEKIIAEINDFDEIVLKTHRVVTVLNKKGNSHTNAVEFYSDDTEIKKIEARVYNSFGKEIKKYKERDFKDESAVGAVTMYSDDRVKYVEYIPLQYPYTFEFISEVEYTNTAFFPTWMPIDDHYLSVEYAEFEILNPKNVDLRLKPEHFEEFNIEMLSTSRYLAKDIKGVAFEAYSPDLSKVVPRLKGALTSFSMIGVKGQNNNWQDFGKWMHERLLIGTDAIPESTKQDILRLTANVVDDLEKAKIVYKYMQDRTRYISIQIGIGGWKPMLANDVDQLGYGDCKGLTNYTKALMEIAGVETYYTVIYGGRDIRDLDADFSSLQGNHAILAVPTATAPIFLECTSQSVPFGYIAGFTDDRMALLVKPDGGEIVRTTRYNEAESFTQNKSTIRLDESGNIQADLNLISGGYLYDIRQSVETKNHRDQILDYKDEWGYLNDLTIMQIDISNDKETVKFKENIAIVANNYASKSGNRLLFQPNVFNRRNYIPPRYSNRALDFEISRSYTEEDEYAISYPESMEIEAVSDNVEIDTKFGVYKFSIDILENNTIKYSRSLVTKKGVFDKEDYKAYRDFRKKVVKSDKSKIVFKTL